MNTLQKFSIGLLILGATANAQDLQTAQKAIDAEQYAKAKSILKNLIATKPDAGRNYFVLGNLYMTQKLADSAKIMYDKGLLAKTEAHFNNIGLGQIELDNAQKDAAKADFTKALVNTKKKDINELVAIARAYMNSVNPDHKTALEYLNRAVAVQPNDAQLQLAIGDASLGLKDVNNAYSAYRNAADADKLLLLAPLKMGVLTKFSKAFPEAKAAFEDILKTNPNFGPAYRELGETYYLWAVNEKAKYAEYTAKAKEYYEKYMSLTDYSVDSRMRHADFLILTKDYKALEKEANEMQKLDKVNPRILRYLGYSAYENGNIDGAVSALVEFINKPNAKIIGRDYLYLGFAKIKKSNVAGKVDKSMFIEGALDLNKAVTLEPTLSIEVSDFAKPYFESKKYSEAAAIYEAAVVNTTSKNFLYDNYFLGLSLYYSNVEKPAGQKVDNAALAKADKAFGNVIAASPTTQDAYLNKARVNSMIEGDTAAKAEMVKCYEDYVRVATEKGVADSSKSKFVEAYDNIGLYYYATSDKMKAKEYFKKALAIDPTDKTANDNLKLLK